MELPDQDDAFEQSHSIETLLRIARTSLQKALHKCKEARTTSTSFKEDKAVVKTIHHFAKLAEDNILSADFVLQGHKLGFKPSSQKDVLKTNCVHTLVVELSNGKIIKQPFRIRGAQSVRARQAVKSGEFHEAAYKVVTNQKALIPSAYTLEFEKLCADSSAHGCMQPELSFAESRFELDRSLDECAVSCAFIITAEHVKITYIGSLDTRMFYLKRFLAVENTLHKSIQASEARLVIRHIFGKKKLSAHIDDHLYLVFTLSNGQQHCIPITLQASSHIRTVQQQIDVTAPASEPIKLFVRIPRKVRARDGNGMLSIITVDKAFGVDVTRIFGEHVIFTTGSDLLIIQAVIAKKGLLEHFQARIEPDSKIKLYKLYIHESAEHEPCSIDHISPLQSLF